MLTWPWLGQQGGGEAWAGMCSVLHISVRNWVSLGMNESYLDVTGGRDCGPPFPTESRSRRLGRSRRLLLYRISSDLWRKGLSHTGPHAQLNPIRHGLKQAQPGFLVNNPWVTIIHISAERWTCIWWVEHITQGRAQ